MTATPDALTLCRERAVGRGEVAEHAIRSTGRLAHPLGDIPSANSIGVEG
jgi:hypothetical protein